MEDGGSLQSQARTEIEMAEEDDGRTRTGTVWTATAHVITAVIGSGVLALPWSVAQMGWIIGPIALIAFAYVTYYTAILLADCYRTPDRVKGRRNYTYMDVVQSSLGPRDVFLCGLVQYISLWGTMVGYTITATTSIMEVARSNCNHYKGHDASCSVSGTLYMIIFGLVQIVLSQFPSMEKITLLSVLAALMSFVYSIIGLSLCIAKFVSHHSVRGTILGVKVGGVDGVSAPNRTWNTLQALGNLAFAYTYSQILIEIQDTLKSPPPENRTMKRATLYGVSITTIFYVSLGCIGYAAFGNSSPGNILTGFQEPFWLVDIANIAVLIHLLGAYQVYAQPIYGKYEAWLAKKWPGSAFFNKVYTIEIPPLKGREIRFTMCKLILRTIIVIVTTVISLMLPFFNSIMGLIGALGFWPSTVYYPITVYMVQAKIKRGQQKWVALQCLSIATLVVSVLAAIGSVVGIVQSLKHVTLFKVEL
ncbi:amino acid permease 8 [Canna indica]|uniref:Amino acid permease 8 n=1 Tax=Canna indica TaxID=4628 RepID=A0AAQ3L067_9LILI|nr:amino acid permease 8 [Canna indica]